MSGRVEMTNHHLGGVKCVVSSCAYHTKGDYCNAEHIEIQPKKADNTQETDCATFAPNDYQ